MNHINLIRRLFLLGVVGLASVSVLADGAKVIPLMQKTLHGLENKEGVMLTVEYEPGISSKSHRHNAYSFVYVLEGAIVMQVSGGNPITLAEGDVFYESPRDIHLVSRNASDSEAAKFVVFTVKEKGAPVVMSLQ